MRLLSPSLLMLVVPSALLAQKVETCTAPIFASPRLPATIPFELHGNHVTFTVCRGDRPLTFVLDTGAGMSILDLETARSMGLERVSSFRANGAGAGSIEAGRINTDSVLLPDAMVRIPIATVMDFRAITGPEGGAMQGILGADFLNRFVVALDYRNLQMRLLDRDSFEYKGSGSTVPFRLVNSFIRVNGDIGLADGAHIPGDFVVDVGSSLALSLAKPFVEANQLRARVGPTLHRPSGRGVGGTSFADVGRVESLTLGGVSIARPITNLFADSAGVFSNSALGDGNIGGDILRRFTVYFDYRGRRMILEPNDRTSELFETDMSGLQLALGSAADALSVEFVLDNSPAARSGLRKGDAIVDVDGARVTRTTLEGFRLRMRREGENVRLTVLRDGREIEMQFVTRRLV